MKKQKSEKKKSKKKLYIVIAVLALLVILASAGGGEDDPATSDTPSTADIAETKSESNPDSETVADVVATADKSEPESETEPTTETEPAAKGDSTEDNTGSEDGKLESGSYTLPCGMELQYADNVRNDVTGNWRLSRTASGKAVSDYAMEYYETMFSNDEEVHGIVNFILNTTTRINAMSGCLFVDTYEYVDKEEHDAKILFSGELLTSKIFDLETGEEMTE